MIGAVSTDTADLRSIFESVPLFAAVSQSARDDLWSQALVRTALRGDILVSQGSSTERFHVLLRGEATSTHVTLQGRNVSLARWVAPVIIDKVAMFAESKHPASVVADTSVTWFTVPFKVVQCALDASSTAQRHALSTMAIAASAARESFVDVVVRPSAARLARWIAVSGEVGAPINLPHPQERLALQLGMTRVTLNRALHRLAAQQVIEVNGASVVVLDIAGLRRIADL